MAKIHIENGIISSSADYSLYHGTSPLATVEAGGLRVQGDVIAENMIVSSSTTYMTTSFSAGSTAFGDTLNDTHQFTGSLNVTGSISIRANNGDITAGTEASLYLRGLNQGIKIQRHNSTNTGAYTHLYTDVVSTDFLYVKNNGNDTGGIATDRIGAATVNPLNNMLYFNGGQLEFINGYLGGTSAPYQIHNNSGLAINLKADKYYRVSGSTMRFTPKDPFEIVGDLDVSGNVTASGNFTIGDPTSVFSDKKLRVTGDGIFSSATGAKRAVYAEGNTGDGNYLYAGMEGGDSEKLVKFGAYLNTGLSELGYVGVTQGGDTVFSGNVSGSSTSTGSFGKLIVDDARFKDDIFIGSSGTSGFRDGGDTNISVYIANTERFKFYNYGGNIYFASNNASGPNIWSGASSTTNATYRISGRTNTGFGGGTDKISGIVDGTEVLQIAANKISGSSTSTGSFGNLRSANRLTIDVPNWSGGSTTRGIIDINEPTGFGDAYILTYNNQENDFHIFSDQGRVKFYSSPSSAYDGTGQAAFIFQGNMDDDGAYLIVGNGNSSHVPLIVKPNMISGSSTTTGSFGSVHIADRLGIGTTNTFEPVTVYPDQDIMAIFGKSVLRGSSDLMYLSHYDKRSAGGGFAVRQAANGQTNINASSGENLNLSINNDTIGRINASGLEVITGNISGSATSTGSFGRVESHDISIPSSGQIGFYNEYQDSSLARLNLSSLYLMNGSGETKIRQSSGAGTMAFQIGSTTIFTTKENNISGSGHVTASFAKGFIADGLTIGGDNTFIDSKLNVTDGHIRLDNLKKLHWAGTNNGIRGTSSGYLEFMTGNSVRMKVASDITFPNATKISGSSTSTGSFGFIQVDKDRMIEFKGSSDSTNISLRNTSANLLILKWGANDRIKFGNGAMYVTQYLGANIPSYTFDGLTNYGLAGGNNAISLMAAGNHALTVDSNSNITLRDNKNLGSSTYSSGFSGQGYQIGLDSSNLYQAEFDNLFVRGRMTIYELLINQIRASNGAIYVSDAAKVESVTPVNASSFKLNFDTGSGYGHPFQGGDLLKAQRFDGSGTYVSRLTVTGIAGTSGLTASLQGGDTPPSGGFEFVRVGSTSDTDRQGAIYLTNSDNGAPFIDIYDGVNSHVVPTGSQYLKVRTGKLNGITSPQLGSLSGFGFYASGSAFLEGTINATAGGVIGGWDINTSTISKNSVVLDSSGIVRSATNFTSGDGFFLSSTATNNFRVGNSAGQRLQFTGDNVEIYNEGNTKLVSLGSFNEIAGWGITTSIISSSAGNVQMDAGNSRFLIQDPNGKQRVRMGLLNANNQYGISGSDANGNLLFKLGEAGNEIAGWALTQAAISSSDGNVQIDSANSRFLIKSGSGERVRMGLLNNSNQYGISGSDASGNLLFKLGDAGNEIAGWEIAQGLLRYDNASGSIALDASNQNISIHTGSINTAKPKVVMGNLPTTGNTRYGFAVFSGSGNADISDDDSYSVLITKDKARLAGWDLVPGRLKSGTVADINGNNASIALGGGNGGTNALNAGSTPTSNLFFVSASSNPIFYVGENFSYVNDTLTAAGWTLNAASFTSPGNTITIHSTDKYIAIGTGGYKGTNTIYLDGDNSKMSIGQNFFYESDELTINGSATIAGWDINSSEISKVVSSNTRGITIGSSIFAIIVHGDDGKDSFAGTGKDNVKLAIGRIATNKFGIVGFDGSGNETFKLGDDGNRIANMEVSASEMRVGEVLRFKGDTGQITGSAILFKGGRVGGMVVDGSSVSVGTDLVLRSSGHLTASNAQIAGKITATSGQIATFSITSGSIDSDTSNTKRGLKLEPGDSIRGYGNEGHKTVSRGGIFSFGVGSVAPPAGGENFRFSPSEQYNPPAGGSYGN